MLTYRCDCCGAEITDWGDGHLKKRAKRMYEVKIKLDTVYDSDNYDGMHFCHDCIGKLYHEGLRRRFEQNGQKEN